VDGFACFDADDGTSTSWLSRAGVDTMSEQKQPNEGGIASGGPGLAALQPREISEPEPSIERADGVRQGDGTAPLDTQALGAREQPPASIQEVAQVAAIAVDKTPSEGEKSDQELQRLRQRVQEQDERWEQATKLLSDIAQRQTQQVSTPSKGSGYFGPLAVLAAIVVVAVTGLLYLHTKNSSVASDAKQQTALTTAAPPVVAMSPQTSTLAAAQPPASTGQIPHQVTRQQTGNPPVSVPKAAAPQAASASHDESVASAEVPPPAVPPKAATEVPALNDDISKQVSQFLHAHHLPFVDAAVFTTSTGIAKSMELSGQVRSAYGKHDAEVKAKDYLGVRRVRIKNRIEINLALASSPSSSAAGDNTSAPTGEACTSSCQSDQVVCAGKCRNDATANAPSTVGNLIGSATSGIGQALGGLMGQAGQAGLALKQCTDTCDQTFAACANECQSAGTAPSDTNASPMGNEAQSSGGSEAPSSEGPDHPPE